MTHLLDLFRLYVQSAGVQNSIDSGPGREPWIGDPRSPMGTENSSEWGTVDPAFMPGLPSNCTLTRYANGDVLVTPNAGATVMRVTVQSRDTAYGDFASVRVTARYDITKQTQAASWFTTTLTRPGSVLVTGSAGAAPANPAGSSEATYVLNMGVGIPNVSTDTPFLTCVLTFTRTGINALQPVILRAGTKVYTGPKYMVETPVLAGPVQRIEGDTISIVAQRGLSLKGCTDQLDPGVLKAIVKGATYDPGVNTALRPGSRVWLVGRKTNVGGDNINGAGSPGPAMWKLLWAGKVLNGDADYDENGGTRVTIEATDAVAELANVPAPLAWGRYNPLTGGDAGGVVSAAARMQRLLYTYLPRAYWQMADTANGSAGDANPQVQDKDDGANLLTQIQRVRDTARGWFWLDAGSLGLRNNGAGILSPAPEFAPNLRLRFAAGNSPLTTTPRYLATDNPAETGLKYVQLKTSFSARALCNAVTMKVHTANSESTYGPYTNQDSLTQWGAQSDEVELHELEGWSIFGGIADPSSAANVGSFLKRYATPQRYPSSVVVNVTEDLTPALDSQPYDALRVKRLAVGPGRAVPGLGALDSTVRVLKLTHTITADRKRPEKAKWLLQYDTRPIEGTAAVPVTPPDATNSPNGQTAGGDSVEATQPYVRLTRRGGDYTWTGTTPHAPFWDTFVVSAGLAYDGTNRWFIVPKPGRYSLEAHVSVNVPVGQPSTYFYAVALVNGVEQGGRFYIYANDNVLRTVVLTQTLKLATNDHVQLAIGALTAGPNNFSTGEDRSTVTMHYLGG